VSLFVPLAALAWQHYQPRVPALPAQKIARQHRWLLENFNAGGQQHGLLAWSLGALLPALIVGVLAVLLGSAFELLGWVFEVVLLYFMFGFRAASYRASSLSRLLSADAVADARHALQAWNPGLLPGENKDDLVRQTLEETLKAALSSLFGVLFWYWVAGVGGALLYVLSHSCREQWQSDMVFFNFAQQVVFWLEWLPARVLAFSFAIVGNFQDAMECWRGQANSWLDANEGAILSAGAGALGIRLGGTLHIADSELLRPEIGTEEQPVPESIDAAVALVWRAALLWLAVVGLLWLGAF
jgi:adenosylcobinamide-phosphate synthase